MELKLLDSLRGQHERRGWGDNYKGGVNNNYFQSKSKYANATLEIFQIISNLSVEQWVSFFGEISALISTVFAVPECELYSLPMLANTYGIKSDSI